MSEPTPRLRMFAGPNGSGKSTIKSVLAPELLGFYINPDDLQKAIQDSGSIDLARFGIDTPVADPRAFYAASPLIQRAGLQNAVESLQLQDSRLIFSSTLHDASAYLASVTADFIRTELSVMSSSGWADSLDLPRQRLFECMFPSGQP